VIAEKKKKMNPESDGLRTRTPAARIRKASSGG